MKIMFWIIALVVVFAVWVRVVPTPTARWHVDPASAKSPGVGGYRRDLSLGISVADALTAIDRVALATPRTKVFAGSVVQGRITYVTRSRLWGFPDYTTISAQTEGEQTRLTILGRLRFGVGDGGVNRARIKQWLQVVSPSP